LEHFKKLQGNLEFHKNKSHLGDVPDMRRQRAKGANQGEKLYRDADERESFGAEAPVPTGRLHALLGHLGITSASRYKIKGVLCLGPVKFKAVVEIFSGPRVLYRHQEPAFRASISDAVADVAW
jgi:hypothetical protein